MKNLCFITTVWLCSIFVLQAQNWVIQLQLEQGISDDDFSFSTFKPENIKEHKYARNVSLVVNYKLRPFIYGGFYVTNRKSTYNFDQKFWHKASSIEDGKININRFLAGINFAVKPTNFLSFHVSGGLTFINSTIERGISKNWYVGNQVNLSGKKLNLRTNPFVKVGVQYHLPLYEWLEGHIGYSHLFDFEDELIEDTSLQGDTRSILQLGLNFII